VTNPLRTTEPTEEPSAAGSPYDELVTPWRAWSPQQAAARLAEIRTDAGQPVRWAVAGGWAVDLHLGRITRPHDDLEVSVAADDARAVLTHFAGPEWRWVVPLDGRLYPFASPQFHETHQSWLWSVAGGAFVVDVFREFHDGDTWVCRRDPTIRRPWNDTVHTSADGVPYLAPEAVLLFKAKAARDKDVQDFHSLLPVLGTERRAWLSAALRRVHPGHAWIDILSASAGEA
jgi:Aminoglycoside-2''-adenylyltransferase